MTASRQTRSPVVIGLDIGSTALKAVVVDPASKAILWRDYRRHEARLGATALEVFERLLAEYGSAPDIRVFATGSGAAPLLPVLGAGFVQEVSALTMVVERLYPDVGSVVDLGGQDAKILFFERNPATGLLQSSASMNDKCASGTGATLDKCAIKVGLSMAEMSLLQYDGEPSHHVAARCGVFAETDVVSLIKAGVAAPVIVVALADAIVQQNLAALARGRILRPRVLLVGGPNAFLPVLAQAWRHRIGALWRERGLEAAAALDDRIVVPPDAVCLGAHGAVLFGLGQPDEAGRFAGLDALRRHVEETGRRLEKSATLPPLIASREDLDAFVRGHEIVRPELPRLASGERVRAFVGVDGGSTSSKAVLMAGDGAVVAKRYALSKGNPIEDVRELLRGLRTDVEAQGAHLEVGGVGVTGYAADVLESCLQADANIVETVAHLESALTLFGDVDVICDVGGQDIKVLFLRHGVIRNFKLSNQCSAGNGMLLQCMASQFGVPLQDYAETAFAARVAPRFSYGCGVFLDADRVSAQKQGFNRDELLAGFAYVLPKNIWQYIVGVPRLAELGTRFVLQGGTQANLAAVKAQVDYIEERVPGVRVRVHPHPGEAGAIGAAMAARRAVEQKGRSTFIGLDAAIGLTYQTRNDDSTRCRFCQNLCGRTFIDTRTPDGRSTRTISGFACEKGMFEDARSLGQLSRQRGERLKRSPNLVDHEARTAFTFTWSQQLPSHPTIQPSSHPATQPSNHPATHPLRIALPRVLNLYSAAPFFRAYFRALGVPDERIVFSSASDERLREEGGSLGANDPCHPSKVALAHVRQLLTRRHSDQQPLSHIFFPCVTRVPTWLKGTVDSMACPLAAGTPNVVKAVFTKDADTFAERGLRYLDPSLDLCQPEMTMMQMFDAWGRELSTSREESDRAVQAGFSALEAFERDLQARGKELLESVEREGRVAILLLGRPYHDDPGLNHGILEEFSRLGYPVLSMRAIPRDEAWLERFFREDLRSGRIRSPLEVSDCWPENFGANSAQKVWAAKFAARHPNVAVVDLSSFKCGYDAPVYGVIDRILSTSQTPASMIHDLDANRPAGAIRLRTRTFAYSLALYETRLRERLGMRPAPTGGHSEVSAGLPAAAAYQREVRT